MKATGVIRRIDDLGRIVIPKEIRRTLKINEGDSLEIFVDNSLIVLKKYSILDNITELSTNLVESFSKIFKKALLITDKEKVIACSNAIEKEYLESFITVSFKEIIDSRVEHILNNTNIIINGNSNNYYVLPIVVDSDAIGSIVLIGGEFDSFDKDVIKLLNTILIKNIEE